MLRPTTERPAVGFQNVDLEIVSRDDLGPLVSALAARTGDLNNYRERGKHFVTLELLRDSRNADNAIKSLASLLLALPRGARRLWNEALIKEFDIGIRATDSRQTLVVSPEATKMASKLGARIVITIYPAEDREEST